jgi:hypothetical protein
MEGVISDYQVDSQNKLLPCSECLEASKENLTMLEKKDRKLDPWNSDPETGEVPTIEDAFPEDWDDPEMWKAFPDEDDEY